MMIIVFFFFILIVLFYSNAELGFKSVVISMFIVEFFFSEKLNSLLLTFDLQGSYLKFAQIIIYIIPIYVLHLILLRVLKLFPSKK